MVSRFSVLGFCCSVASFERSALSFRDFVGRFRFDRFDDGVVKLGADFFNYL